MSNNNQNDWCCPIEEQHLCNRVTFENLSDLSIALEECISMSWDVLAELYFRLTPGKVQTIRQDKASREAQVLAMLHEWQATQQQCATFERVNKILDKAKLTATKHRWWNCSRSADDKEKFKEQISALNEYFHNLVKCPITENEWTKLLSEIKVDGKEEDINKAHPHAKFKQRLMILHYWEEKMGYNEATVENLKAALKRARLRRVVCQIAATGNTAKMNERFTHFMEDEWDNIFSNLSEEKVTSVYQSLKPNDPPKDLEEAFDVVIRNGNAGFHTFIDALYEREITDFQDNLDPKYKLLFDLKKISPVASHFKKDIKTFRDMKKNIEENKFLALHGLPGSGKSQCAAAYAKEFKENHPLSVVWFLECKCVESQNEAILSLRKQLLDAKICTNNKPKNDIIKCMTDEIKSSDFYVLLVLEDVYNEITQGILLQLLEFLKSYKKLYVLATTRKRDLVPKNMFKQQNVAGFTAEEAREFLLPPEEEFSEDDITAADEIASRYSYLPLGLAPAKAYSRDQSLSYTDYLRAMDEEMETLDLIKGEEDDWLKNSYVSNKRAGKNILATMILALNSLEKMTLSSRTIDFQDLFSYAIYFHHEKIPIYLFKQLIMQRDITSTVKSSSVSDILCKLAINKFRHQLKVSSIGVVDEETQSISTHRVVLLALRHLAKKNENAIKNDSRLRNALFALACYFQKDNRLVLQHNQLLALMPHVSNILSIVNEKLVERKVQADDNLKSAILLEDMLVIRLQELKGFTCTQSDAVADAKEPLKKAFDRLLKLLCNAGGISVDQLPATVKERVLEGNGPDTQIETKARVLTQYCKLAVDNIPEETFDRLIEAVILNEEDLALFKRICPNVEWDKKIRRNEPLTADGLKLLRDNELALSREKLKSVYLAEQLASILYTRGRLMFYNEFCGDKEQHMEYLKLSYYITKEVVKNTGVRLLHFLISDTNGMLYLKLRDNNKTDEQKRQSYTEAYRKYEKYTTSTEKFYEHGILKEDGKTDYNQMRCYRQMIRANHQSMKLPGSPKEDNRFEVCRKLKRLVHEHPQYAKTAVDALLESGEFCYFGEQYELALEFFRMVLDRVKDKEGEYYRSFSKATKLFSEVALILLQLKPSDDVRRYCEEAKQRCDKALVLVPRITDDFKDEMNALGSELEAVKVGPSDAQNDAKKRRLEHK